jgi:transposase InsO family protein
MAALSPAEATCPIDPMRSWRCSSRSTFLARKYTSNRYTERLAEAGLQASIGTVADSYDNTMAEAVNALFKTELVFWDGPWKGADDGGVP